MNLVSVGFINVLIGLALYTSYEKASNWTASGYYRLTGRKLDYLAAIKFYGMTAVIVTGVGIIVGLIGLFMMGIKLLGNPIVSEDTPTPLRIAAENIMVSAGFIFLIVGLCLYIFNKRVSGSTAVAYFMLTGEKLNYITTLKFYALTGALLVGIGIVAGLVGLFN